MVTKLAQRYKDIIKGKNLKLVEVHYVTRVGSGEVKARILQYGNYIYHITPAPFGYTLKVYQKQ